MKSTKSLVFLFLICYICSSAQVMNVRKWRKAERDSLDYGLLLIDEHYLLQAFPVFEELLKQHPREEFLKYSYAKCAIYRPDKHEEAYRHLSEVYVKSNQLVDIQYDMALVALFNFRFDEAMEHINQYVFNRRTSAEGRQKATRLRQNIESAKYFYNHPTSAKVINMGKPINTEWDEYVPTISADESTLIYTYAGIKSKGGLQKYNITPDLKVGMYLEDIFKSDKKNAIFSDPVGISNLNSEGPDAAISLSADGSILFLYRDVEDGHGDIYQSFLDGERFSTPVKLKGKVNSFSWDGHCSLSPDGKTLYFSSERPGGYGGRDLYKASLSEDSTWVNVVNLGDSINTAFDDDAPFIHADGVTLFFSSKGHNSMGGYDVFRASLNVTDSSFTQVRNLGYPINSTADDIYFVMSASGENAYYSSGRKEGFGMKDIYLVKPGNMLPKPSVHLVKGKVSYDGKSVMADISADIIASEDKNFCKVKSNSANGNYLLSLPTGLIYKLIFTYKNLPPKTILLDATERSGYVQKIYDIDFAPLADTQQIAKVHRYATAPSLDEITENFEPINQVHEKLIRYVQKYANIKDPELEFRVQFAAFRKNKNYFFPGLRRFGAIERLKSEDDFTRLTVGGAYTTIYKAFIQNKRIMNFGYEDAFILAFYKGKRVQFEELENLGVFTAVEK